MGQLLTLATHCINDKDFYQPATSRYITSKFIHISTTKTNVSLDYDSITPKVKDERGFNQMVCDMFRKNNNTLLPSLIRVMTLTFSDEPPIIITGQSVVESENVASGSLYLTNKQWLIIFFNKTIKHTFKAGLTTYKMEYKIQCGSINEVITEEQYNMLIDTYDNVKLRFQQESDQTKIDSRLKQYEK